MIAGLLPGFGCLILPFDRVNRLEMVLQEDEARESNNDETSQVQMQLGTRK